MCSTDGLIPEFLFPNRHPCGINGCMSLLFFLVVIATTPPGDQIQLPTTVDHFTLLGTQPTDWEDDLEPFSGHQECMYCHSDYDNDVAPVDTWVVSLMAQASRDPVFQAALSIANQDANVAGRFCLKCHAPSQTMRGAAFDGELNTFSDEDMDGVACTICHRAVNPIYGPDSAVGYPGQPQDPDLPILSALEAEGLLPESPGNGQLVFDTVDVRRAQYDDVPSNMHGINASGLPIRLIYSPYHKQSQLCGTCHDVGNPLFHKDSDGTFRLNNLETDGPTTDVLQTTSEQRTFSEWLHSDFSTTGVVFPDGRFGGNLPDTEPIHTCQNCHMPTQTGGACGMYEGWPFFERDDVGAHTFSGANTWVIRALRTVLGDDADYYGLKEARVAQADARTAQMLRDASDMELVQDENMLRIRVINQTGHKLPTGYPEGRRMWLNVKFFDIDDALVEERGAYNYATAELDIDSTTVYEKRMAMSDEVAAATNLPAGESFHLALNSIVLKDNCIPPRGFTNAAFASFDGLPVGHTYQDQQYWDDTSFVIPAGATHASVTLLYQTTSKEYVEFLRDANVTDDRGQTVADLWEEHGKSAPVAMDSMELALKPGDLLADLNGDGVVNGGDLGLMLVGWDTTGPGDINGDGIVNGADLGLLLIAWSG